MKYDVFANWEINRLCNFRCKYCFNPDEIKGDPGFRGHEIEKVINGFNNAGPVFLIHMSGGEPFLHPDFVELCEGLTKKHCISINSNLSTGNVYDFAEKIDPGRVEFIHCSLHLEERERRNHITDFIEMYKCLKNAGFTVFATQVLYPPLFSKFEKYYEVFRENGIILGPRSFRGYYRYAKYPAGYPEKERRKILRYLELSQNPEISKYAATEQLFERYLVNGDMSFRGLPCKAGKDIVTINYDGDVFRCPGIPVKMGNIFDGKISLYKENRPCPASICSCPAIGFIGAEGEPEIIKSSMIKDRMNCLIGRVKGAFRIALNH